VSHHLDSPQAQQDPRLDISDVYLFRGTTGTVFVLNVNPLSGTGGFHPEGRYEFKVDVDGDAVEDITYRVTFDEADADGTQPWHLERLDGADAADDSATGIPLSRGTTGVEGVTHDGIRVYAGAAADTFYIDGGVVTAVCAALATGTAPDLSSASGTNLFAGTNVRTIVLEVPDDALGATDIGFWGRTALATDSGGWRSINRCALPLMNTLFNPSDSELANEWNATAPVDGAKLHRPRLVALITGAVAATGSSPDPAGYAERVADLLLPDVLRYQVGTPATFGFAHRNGRGLTEPVPEVMFALVLNRAVPLGLDHTTAGGVARSDFPYLPPPVAPGTAV
jgi:hypothetical protein